MLMLPIGESSFMCKKNSQRKRYDLRRGAEHYHLNIRVVFNHRGSTKMSSSGQSRVMLVKVNASPPVCRDLAISCFGISNSIPYTTER